jgi:16S rRNA processing protein RimM
MPEPAPPRSDGGADAPADLIDVGVLRGSYGLQGWVHLQPHSVDAAVLRRTRRWWLLRPQAREAEPAGTRPAPDEVAAALQVTGLRVQGAGLVAKWQGCDDPESAQALKGWRIAVGRDDFPPLPEGEYYWVDLVGAQVVNRQGLTLGTVRGLRSNGAHDILEVARAGAVPVPSTASAPVLLIPLVAAYVDGIDLPAMRISVDWAEDW